MKSKAQSEDTGIFDSFGRRDFLKSGVGAAALGMISMGRANAAPAAPCPKSGELFAFRAPDATALVFAVAFPEGPLDAVAPTVHIHAGSRIWTVDGGALSPSIQGQASARIYVGRIGKPTPLGEKLHRLIVVSAPSASLSTGVLPVWAEVVGQGGSRLRLGNPIVAELLTRTPEVSGIFHEVQPTRDHALFAEVLADQIAARGAAAGVGDPKLRGSRLAAKLLPDVLSFDPDLPVGFTFVGQNGRRPSDAVASIVDTMLAGIATAGKPTGDLFTASNAFPYFQTAAA